MAQKSGCWCVVALKPVQSILPGTASDLQQPEGVNRCACVCMCVRACVCVCVSAVIQGHGVLATDDWIWCMCVDACMCVRARTDAWVYKSACGG